MDICFLSRCETPTAALRKRELAQTVGNVLCSVATPYNSRCPVTEHAAPTGAEITDFSGARRQGAGNECNKTGPHAGTALFLEALFKDDAAFEEDALRVYASDASLRRGPVLAMVRPRTVEQVRELMRWAEVERIPIHPRGRGTSLSGGCVPTRAGVVVSMLGMDRIFDISSEDFVAVIEPGVNTLAFQQACEQKGLFYPPDPASGKATSVGGNVMTCAGGLRAVKYGVTRDYVLGMEVVLPGGKLLKLGGRTHKDVIGLDISRMFVGSEGTLGIVTKLYLKLLPKPESSASVLVGYPSLDAALSSMSKVFAAGILPCAVEFMNETVLEILSRTGDVPWPDTVKSLLLFQVDGSRETVPLENARLAAQLDDALWSMQGVGKEEEDRLWAFRRRGQLLILCARPGSHWRGYGRAARFAPQGRASFRGYRRQSRQAPHRFWARRRRQYPRQPALRRV